MPQHSLALPNGITIPTLGQGTWFMGESRSERSGEVAALKHGIDIGMTLIDTAEMYGNGGAEEVVGEAIAGVPRENLFIVSKVLPSNASRQGTIAACERSLKRMKTDYIDIYLLHWQGSHPLQDTFAAFQQLMEAGKIRAFGVSNFDTRDMKEAVKYDSGICLNQVLYNLGSRGIEWDLLPWQKERGIATMAYSPLHQTHLLRSSALRSIAQQLSITPAQLALAWLLHQGTIPIPKSSNPARLDENCKAWDIVLSAETLKALDVAFPPPTRKMPLDML